MQLLNLFLWPLGIFLELTHKYFILGIVLSKAFLHLLSTLDPMSDDNTRDVALSSFRLFTLSFLLFAKRSIDCRNKMGFSRANPDRCGSIGNSTCFIGFSKLLCTCKCSGMLLKGSFRSLEKKCIYTLIKIFTGHIVVYDAKAMYKYGSSVICKNVVLDLGQFTLLLYDFDGLATILTGFTCLSISKLILLRIFLQWTVQNSFLLFGNNRELFLLLGRRCRFLVELLLETATFSNSIQSILEVELRINSIERDLACLCLCDKIL